MRDILGGKGAGLAEMANLGLPVPPGFTISAKLWLTYLEQGTFPDQLHDEVGRHLKQLEQATRKKFGDPKNPLLVSVRSGAAVSMPGMMETILNLGLNDETVQGLVAGAKNPRFAYDSYRRFVQMDRKSTRLNSSHGYISYAVFCLKKKNTEYSPHCSVLQHADTEDTSPAPIG